MFTLNVSKLQDLHFIRSSKNDEIIEFVRPIITDYISSSCITIEKEKYISFLKLVYLLFGRDVTVKESHSFDSQELESDFMFTNQISTRNIIDVIHDHDACFQEINQPNLAQSLSSKIDIQEASPSRSSSLSSASSLSGEDEKQQPFKELNRQMVKIQKNGDDLKVTFDFDPKVIAAIKEIEGRKYDSTTRAWSVPKEKKSILLKKMFQLNKTVNLC